MVKRTKTFVRRNLGAPLAFAERVGGGIPMRAPGGMLGCYFECGLKMRWQRKGLPFL